MTIDEAIQDAIRQVPECAPPSNYFIEGPHGEAIERAFWFDAAFSWLATRGPLPRVLFEGGVWTESETAMGSSWTGEYTVNSGSWPTKYHWLRERILLAKGIQP